MNVDHDMTTTSYHNADYTSANNEGNSKSEREKARYVQKEQIHRQKQMTNENKIRHFLETAYPQHRIPSLSVQSTGTETELNEDEWTPQDSSYGAAFPFCGCIPKSIRQAIEKAMIALAGFLVIYAIVSIAILLTGDGESKKTKTYKDNHFTDDFYVDDQFYADDYSNYSKIYDDGDYYNQNDY